MESTATSTGSGDMKACPRGHWKPSEDAKLRQLVEQFGPHNWNSIAEKLQGRSGVFSLTFSCSRRTVCHVLFSSFCR